MLKRGGKKATMGIEISRMIMILILIILVFVQMYDSDYLHDKSDTQKTSIGTFLSSLKIGNADTLYGKTENILGCNIQPATGVLPFIPQSTIDTCLNIDIVNTLQKIINMKEFKRYNKMNPGNINSIISLNKQVREKIFKMI